MRQKTELNASAVPRGESDHEKNQEGKNTNFMYQQPEREELKPVVNAVRQLQIYH